jgi:transposase
MHDSTSVKIGLHEIDRLIARRLQTNVATALVAEVGDWKVFSSGRSLAAWIGLVPRQHSTEGKERLGRISKQGNRHLRWLLVAGAMAVIRYARQHGTKRPWLARLMQLDTRNAPAAAKNGRDKWPRDRQQ